MPTLTASPDLMSSLCGTALLGGTWRIQVSPVETNDTCWASARNMETGETAVVTASESRFPIPLPSWQDARLRISG